MLYLTSFCAIVAACVGASFRLSDQGRASARRYARRALPLMLALAVFYLPAVAQTVTAGGTIPLGGGFNFPFGVAVDGSGNVYVADQGNSAVKEIPFNCARSSCVSTLGGGFSQPVGVAVDGRGNVYVADWTDTAVKEMPPGCVSSSCVTTLGGGFNSPWDVAVDGSGNIYVADSGNNAVKKIPSGCSSSSCVSTLGGGFNGPFGVAVDGSGNVYVGDQGNNAVKEIPFGCVNSSCVAALGGGFSFPSGVAVDGSGNVYVGDYGNNAVKQIPSGCGSSGCVTTLGGSFNVPAGVAVDGNGNVYVGVRVGNAVGEIVRGATNFHSANVGATSATISIPFSITGSEIFGVPVVLTEGATGKDFAYVSSVCSGSTCTVNVTLTPRYAGLREGAVEMVDGSGNPLATAYVYGIGVGPQATFQQPGQASAVLGGRFIGPAGVAVDGSGNVYAADQGTNAVMEIPFGCVGSSCMTTLGGGFRAPTGVALDAGGNVYVADRGNGAVKEIPPGCGGSSCVITLGGGFFSPNGVALDWNGNVYVADQGNNAVKEIPFGCVSPSCVSTLGGGFNSPQGVAVDGSGNLYVADGSNNAVKEMPSGCSSSSCVGTLGGGFNFPAGVAMGESGNVYVADSNNFAVKELTYATPPSLSYATATAVGSTDTTDGAQTVTVANIGNAGLVFPAPMSGNNASISSGFTLGGSGSCPDLSTSSSAATLAAGGNCTYLINFAPTLGGATSGSLVLTNNSLNAANTTQSISLSGTGIASATSFTLTGTPASTAAGSAISYTVTAYDANGVDAQYTGTVTFTSTDAQAALPANYTFTGVDAGVHTFTGLTTLKTAGAQTVTVADTAATAATGSSPDITINVGSAYSIAAATGSGQRAAMGTAFTSPLTVRVLDQYSNPIAATVTFTAPSAGASATLSAPNCTSSATATPAGSCSVTATANGTLSTTAYSVSAAVSGVATPATFSLTNAQNSTTIVTTPSATSLVYGQPLTLNAAITPASVLTSAPSGDVEFTEGATVLTSTAAVANAAASDTISVPTVATHTYTAQYLGDTNFMASAATNATSTVTVNQASATLTAPTSTTQVPFGRSGSINIAIAGLYSGPGISAPSGTIGDSILDASNSLVASGSPTISASAATISLPNTLAAGNYTVSVSYPGDGNYAPSVAPVTLPLVVGQIQQTITWAQPGAITYGTTLAAVLNAQVTSGASPVAGTYSYLSGTAAVTAATVLPVGAHALTVNFTPTDTATYTTATATVSLTVAQAMPAISLTSSANPILTENATTFIATVLSAASAPTGTVMFYDNTAAASLGSVPLSNGVATLSVSTLPAGAHSITAIYPGDANFVTLTSSAVSEQVDDFSLILSSAGGSQTVAPGATATYHFTISPAGATTFPAAIALSVGGLPAGATSTVTPDIIASGAGATNVTLTITTLSQTGLLPPMGGLGQGLAPITLAFLLLPFSFGMRRRARTLGRISALRLLLLMGGMAVAGLTGCGGVSQTNSSMQPQQTTYNIMVTGTAGALNHSATVTLTVE